MTSPQPDRVRGGMYGIDRPRVPDNLHYQEYRGAFQDVPLTPSRRLRDLN